MVDVDPLASLRVWAVDVEVGGRTFEVPASPASDWFPVLAGGDPLKIMDLVDQSGSDGLDELILSGDFDLEELGESLADAVREVTGRPPMVAYVLAYVAKTHWMTINGVMVSGGFRWDTMPIGAALDAIYSIVTRNMDKEDRGKFDALLEAATSDRKTAIADFEATAGPQPKGGLTIGELSEDGRPRTLPRSQPRRQVDQ
jgi:hypothetical protein